MYRSTLSAVAIAALAGTFALQTQAESAHSNLASETVKVWKVDRSGHPPFKRELVEMDVVDAARLEPAPASDANTETVTIRTVDRTGKPPYQRGTETLPVSDIAAFEEAGTVEETIFRGRPPFSRHR
ncbi:MAG: hypothetical protein RIC38_17400 [Chromatocurvus sp.]